MRRQAPLIAGLLFLIVLFGTPARSADDDGFVAMFNGKDLTGWVNVNCAPETFFVKDDMIITTGRPTGFLRTGKQYENFIMEFDWMHMNKTEVGNSGLFVWGDPLPAQGSGYTRGIEVQVLVNLEKENAYTSHGDLFSIWGAHCKPDRPHPMGWERCLPSERRCKGGGEWNHYRVEANDGAIKLAVNGKVVSGVSQCNPRKGYLALESEGAECRFKNLKIKELPSTKPGPKEIAHVAKNFKSIYTGLDLRGWKQDPKNEGHWQPHDWVLNYDGKGTDLWSVKEYGDFEMICDWRWTAKPTKKLHPVILPDGTYALAPGGKQTPATVMDTKLVDKAAFDALGDVIDYGADLFNTKGDHAGCYQAYRTGLITVREFLDHHRDLQKTINEGLARAQGERRGEPRAFVLREVLGEVRKQVERRSGPFKSAQGPKGKSTKAGMMAMMGGGQANKQQMVEVDDAGDSGIYLRGSSRSQVNMWCWPIGSGEVYGYRTDPKMSAEVRRGVTPTVKADRPIGQWNRFKITMKGDRLTVVLNGKKVIENAQLPDVAPRGPIALQNHGDPIQFANLFIRELE